MLRFYATAASKIANYMIRLSKYIYFFFLEKNGIVLINETLQQYDRRHILQKGFRFVWYYRILWSKLSNIGKSPVVYWVLSSHESADIEDRIASRRKINHEHDAMAEIPLSPNDCHNNELYLSLWYTCRYYAEVFGGWRMWVFKPTTYIDRQLHVLFELELFLMIVFLLQSLTSLTVLYTPSYHIGRSLLNW